MASSPPLLSCKSKNFKQPVKLWHTFFFASEVEEFLPKMILFRHSVTRILANTGSYLHK